MEQATLDLAPSPRNPALVLYKAWDGLLDYYGGRASIGDRVTILRFDEETGQIKLRCSRYYADYLSIWPDGSFELHRHTYSRFGWWEQHTFFDFQWAIRERVVVVKPMEPGQRWLNERDWCERKPYLRLSDVVPGTRYSLALHNGNQWIFRTHAGEGVWQQQLDNGYAFAQARYDRFQHRAENRGTLKARNRLAMHTANGHVTGAAAVEQMASLLHVHAPKAQEGS